MSKSVKILFVKTFCVIKMLGDLMFKIRLKKIRESKGLSQKQLAIFLDVSQGAVGNWESGTRMPNLEILGKIADYFDVTTDYLLGKEDCELQPDSIDSVIYEELQKMTDSEKEEILAFINFTKSKRESSQNIGAK